jgi:hypothetical protein
MIRRLDLVAIREQISVNLRQNARLARRKLAKRLHQHEILHHELADCRRRTASEIATHQYAIRVADDERARSSSCQRICAGCTVSRPTLIAYEHHELISPSGRGTCSAATDLAVSLRYDRLAENERRIGHQVILTAARSRLRRRISPSKLVNLHHGLVD